jgi:hypothetical protein
MDQGTNVRWRSEPPRPSGVDFGGDLRLEIVSPIDGKVFAISAEPKMPMIDIEVRVSGLLWLAASRPYTCFANIRYNGTSCPNGPNRDFDCVLTPQQFWSDRFQLEFPDICGGDLVLPD